MQDFHAFFTLHFTRPLPRRALLPRARLCGKLFLEVIRMYLIICVDDDMGVSFNRRRQSQDRALRARILARTAQTRLWMSAYTARQFEAGAAVCVSEDCINVAGHDEYCFAELQISAPLPEDTQGILLYRWNRRYPSDCRFTLPPEFHLAQRDEFAGFSHEKITEELYLK